MPVKLIADSGATKCEWCLTNNTQSTTVFTTGISPYFLNIEQIIELVQKELLTKLKTTAADEIYFYGTGLGNPDNVNIARKALQQLFPTAKIEVNTDLLGAARALCGNEKGIACILGTGSNSCFYDGSIIVENTPSLGYILGDEGSGAYLGKKVIQYYLYNTFDKDLKNCFDAAFRTNQMEILETLYKKPFPNRYLAGFAIFLADNRGHYMIENIVEEGLKDFFLSQLKKYKESLILPVNFTGSIAFGFKDIIEKLCSKYNFRLGKVLKNPMEGLVKYHTPIT